MAGLDARGAAELKELAQAFVPERLDHDATVSRCASRNKRPNVEVTGAARLYRAASVWTAGLAIMSLAMTVWTYRDGIFHGILPAVSQLVDVVDFQEWFAVRFLEKRRWFLASLAHTFCA